ncbi:SH3 domain-containing protein [Paracoccus contaminans]
MDTTSSAAGRRLPARRRAGLAAAMVLGLSVAVSIGLSGARAQGGPGQAGEGGTDPAAAGRAVPSAAAPAPAGAAVPPPPAAAAGGDGSAALEVDRTEITADSLISRHQAAPRDPGKGPVTNLPLPRYVSLKGGEGNARRGPSLSHRIDWVFRHPGMPLRVVAEFGHWRRVEDQDGAGGWVHYSLLSGVRTAIITTDMAELRARADGNGAIIARAEAGAIVRLHECVRDWCRVSGGGEKGWVVKTSLWGVDAGEIRE